MNQLTQFLQGTKHTIAARTRSYSASWASNWLNCSFAGMDTHVLKSRSGKRFIACFPGSASIAPWMPGWSFRRRSIWRTRPVEQPAICATSAVCICGFAAIFSPQSKAVTSKCLFRWIRKCTTSFASFRTCSPSRNGCTTKLEFSQSEPMMPKIRY